MEEYGVKHLHHIFQEGRLCTFLLSWRNCLRYPEPGLFDTPSCGGGAVRYKGSTGTEYLVGKGPWGSWPDQKNFQILSGGRPRELQGWSLGLGLAGKCLCWSCGRGLWILIWALSSADKIQLRYPHQTYYTPVRLLRMHRRDSATYHKWLGADGFCSYGVGMCQGETIVFYGDWIYTFPIYAPLWDVSWEFLTKSW